MDPFAALAQELARLPGMGRRSAERAALALVRRGAAGMDALSAAIAAARDGIVSCSTCGAITTRDRNPCRMCTDPMRDGSVLLVVEDQGDVLSIERSGAYRGLYHVLGGRVSPMAGTGPADLAVDALRRRLSGGAVRETILALPTDVEGDATASWLAEIVSRSFPDVRVTRLAFGLPADSAVRYSDPLTLRRAIAGRVAGT
ncbi:MAG: recombination protein RecR [Kiritimatiellae bacterium]|nr:recombination protein RecR [Kiritimatiellia bacterium]